MYSHPRIAIIYPFWDFWQNVLTDDPREFHEGQVSRSAAVVGEYGDVLWTERTEGLRETLPTVDIIVVIATMASPPLGIRTFLQKRPESAVLIWALHDSPQAPEPFTHESITLRGATVGCSMLTASLTKAGIAHDVVLGNTESSAVHRSLRIVAAAALMRSSRISVIGKPLAGYDFITPEPDELALLGIDLIVHSPEELADRAASVPDTSLRNLRVEFGANWRGATTEAGAQTSLRYALALDSMMEADGSRAGALNCHVQSLRLDPELGGVAPCFALGRATTRGRPWTCTGDLNTTLAMLFAASLDLPTFYHEVEAIDETTNELILANSGEHDGRFGSVAAPETVSNPWFPGGTRTPIVAFQVSPGPASMIAVSSVAGRLRMIVAEGHFTERSTERTGTMSAAFRFDKMPAVQGWRDWVRAGAGHHSCATNSHVREDLRVLCEHLGLELAVVGREHPHG